MHEPQYDLDQVVLGCLVDWAVHCDLHISSELITLLFFDRNNGLTNGKGFVSKCNNKSVQVLVMELHLLSQVELSLRLLLYGLLVVWFVA